VLSKASPPFADLLAKWIENGELADPLGEFFVAAGADTRRLTDPNGDECWRRRFELIPQLVPSFMREETATTAFLIGKTLNFLREECHDAEGLRLLSLAVPRSASLSLDERIAATATHTNAQLRNFILFQTPFVSDCIALRDYFLLMRGEFVHRLMDALWQQDEAALLRPDSATAEPAAFFYSQSPLDDLLFVPLPDSAHRRPTRSHHLEYPPPLNARVTDPDHSFLVPSLLPAPVIPAASGAAALRPTWDTFQLTYKVRHPVTSILTKSILRQYESCFSFLWTLHRITYVLHRDWVRIKVYDPLFFPATAHHFFFLSLSVLVFPDTSTFPAPLPARPPTADATAPLLLAVAHFDGGLPLGAAALLCVRRRRGVVGPFL
jgi:gamma-tubulin complex component 3